MSEELPGYDAWKTQEPPDNSGDFEKGHEEAHAEVREHVVFAATTIAQSLAMIGAAKTLLNKSHDDYIQTVRGHVGEHVDEDRCICDYLIDSERAILEDPEHFVKELIEHFSITPYEVELAAMEAALTIAEAHKTRLESIRQQRN